MTDATVTPAECRLLDIQRARGIPFPADFLAWRRAHAAAVAALEAEPEAEADP